MSFDKYQFLAWSRRGIAADIAETDTLGKNPGSVKERAIVPVAVKINNDISENQKFTLIGPGDITGIQNSMIIRTEPRPGVSDFEPNLLACIEFYDEDFPWRYTPARATGPENLHLRPWITLIVLREDEFQDTPRRSPLPSIKVLNPSALPPHDELHLWGHMHSNLPNTETGLEKFIESLKGAAKTDPDGIYSRLICPRKLEPKLLYHAFLVPSYETGRLAGLGMKTKDVPAQKPAWPSNDLEFPYYYRWDFRTSENFDFEYLVKLLEPRVMDKRVGTRPMDCSAPGFVQADTPRPVSAPKPKILMLEGALKAPNAVSTPYPPAEPQDFLTQLQKLVNLNQIQKESAEDPIVTVPFYGMFHAQKKDPINPGGKLLPTFKFDSDTWVNDLNRDPRNRVPAGFGLRVIQENQDKLMDKAWKQLVDVLEANRRATLVQFHARIAERAYSKTIATLSNNPEQLLSLTRSLSARILVDKTTVRGLVQESILPNALFSPTFRRITRNQTTLMRGLEAKKQVFNFQTLVRATNSITGLKAAPNVQFNAFSEVADLINFNPPQSLDQIKVWSLDSNLDQNFALNLTGFKGGLPNITKWTAPFTTTIFTGGGGGGVVNPGGGGVVVNPGGGGVVINPGGGGVVINPGGGVIINPGGGIVKPGGREMQLAGEDFRTAYMELNTRFGLIDQVASAPQPMLATGVLASQILTSLQPAQAYKKYFDARVKWPTNILKIPREEFLPAMAYPDFPEATYQYLVDIDKELLLPNLELIPPNTLSLLRTNQKFIESYLVGLNYEMGRELLWREYPTDMRGSYFRQFWDVNGLITPDANAQNTESLKDIKPIHKWPSTSKLGSHNARDAEGDAEQLVFVVRGDLLKKFPNTVLFAQKAVMKGNKKVININPAENELLFPQYQAELPPDIKLLGFDLTIEQAAGTQAGKGFTDQLGWFFILAEVPGEPRFGMDISYNPNIPNAPTFTWNDLSWENFGAQQISFVKAGLVPGNTSSGKRFISPNIPNKGIWGKSSADMAAILLQRPVMMAIHATEMLDRQVANTNADFGSVTTLKAELRGTPVTQIKWL